MVSVPYGSETVTWVLATPGLTVTGSWRSAGAAGEPTDAAEYPVAAPIRPPPTTPPAPNNKPRRDTLFSDWLCAELWLVTKYRSPIRSRARGRYHRDDQDRRNSLEHPQNPWPRIRWSAKSRPQPQW